MGRKKSNNNWSGPLSKAERKRVKEGFTVFERNTGASQESAAAAVPAAHRKQQFKTRGLAPRQNQTSNNSWVHAVGFVMPKSRRHIMNISDLSSIHAGPLADFLGKEWRWGNPDKPIPHKAVYYASRACLGGNHPRHWVPRVH